MANQKKNLNKIVFIHSLNNFTGSPNVLSTIIKALILKGYAIDIITSKSNGFLTNIKGASYIYTYYRWKNNRLWTFLLLLISQIQIFVKLIFSSGKNNLYYINTIVPIGAVWACILTRKDFIYHAHEDMSLDKPLYGIYRFTYRFCNRKTIFVSQYLKNKAVNVNDGIIIHNAIENRFKQRANTFIKESPKTNSNIILMVASLRRFKGIYEFVELSKSLPDYAFELVLSATPQEVENFILEVNPLNNLKVFSVQSDLHPFYQRARILLQLSHTDTCIETFGLTILEAMIYGIPSIVPNVGGPIELIDNGVNGFSLNTRDLDLIIEKIVLLMEDHKLYNSFSQEALKKSINFEESRMIHKIEKYITE